MVQERQIFAGTIVKVHGLRGDVKVHLPSEREALLRYGQRFMLYRDGALIETRSAKRVVPCGGGCLVRFEGITEVETASRLVGCEIWISPGELSFPAGEDEHPAALVGMSVSDARLGEIGVVEDFFATAAHGILVVQGEYDEVLLPNVPGFKKMVDWKERRLLVELPEGLVDNGR